MRNLIRTLSKYLKEKTYTADADYQLNNFTLVLRDEEASNTLRRLQDEWFNKYVKILFFVYFGMVVKFLVGIVIDLEGFKFFDCIVLAQVLLIFSVWSLLKRKAWRRYPTSIVVYLIPLLIGVNKNLFVRGIFTESEENRVEKPFDEVGFYFSALAFIGLNQTSFM